MILLFGLAGSGKSTQGQILAKKFGWQWLSAGQVLREAGGFEETMNKGELVDDATVVRLMKEKIQEIPGQVIVDGFPRSMGQMDKFFGDEKMVQAVDMAILIEVPKEELFKRIKSRGRVDDTEDAVKKRFQIVEQNICSILSLLKSKNVPVHTVDGMGAVEDVTKRIEEILK